MKKRFVLGKMANLSSMLAGTLFLGTSFASVPRHVTNDTAIYQNLSEIRVQRQKELSFDADIARLSGMESRYRERLPLRSQKVSSKKLSKPKKTLRKISSRSNPS